MSSPTFAPDDHQALLEGARDQILCDHVVRVGTASTALPLPAHGIAPGPHGSQLERRNNVNNNNNNNNNNKKTTTTN